MKAFVSACLAVVLIAVAAASVLGARQMNVDEKFARTSVRLDEAKATH